MGVPPQTVRLRRRHSRALRTIAERHPELSAAVDVAAVGAAIWASPDAFPDGARVIAAAVAEPNATERLGLGDEWARDTGAAWTLCEVVARLAGDRTGVAHIQKWNARE
jgi:hypothetical protein